MRYFTFLFITLFLFVGTVFAKTSDLAIKAPLITKDIQANMTPQQAFERLMDGNKRFVRRHRPQQKDYIKKAELTVDGQYPAAIVLACIDSRVPPEIIFDQGVGNIFVTRVAASALSSDVLGGMEYATKVTGSKLIVVLGHESCGAVHGACTDVKLGHLTALLNKIKPAVKQASKQIKTGHCEDSAFINQIAKNNVINVVRAIPQKSSIIKKLVKEGRVMIVGAMYDIETGKVAVVEQ